MHKILSRINAELTEDWRNIGYELLKPDDVENIDSSTKHDKAKCLDMLIKWLKTDPSATYSKLIEALRRYNLSCAIEKIKLNQKPMHKILSRINAELTDDWRNIGYELLEPDYVENIDSSTKHDKAKCLDMLIKWLKTDPSATYSKLIEALCRYDLSCAIEKIKVEVLNN